MVLPTSNLVEIFSVRGKACHTLSRLVGQVDRK